MTTLTNGVVKYERTVKTGDYENKKLSIELSFNIEEGATADPAGIVDQAIDLVHTKLGLKTAPRPATNVVDLTAEAKAAIEAKIAQAKATDTAAADAAKAAFAAKAEKDTKAAAAKAAKAAAEKQQIQTKPEDRAPAEDDGIDMSSDDNLFDGDAPEITDKDLQDKITARNGVIKSAVSIKKLIGKYAPTAGQIPQVQRNKFLEELAVLQPAV